MKIDSVLKTNSMSVNIDSILINIDIISVETMLNHVADLRMFMRWQVNVEVKKTI